MLTQETERFSYHSGCGRFDREQAAENPGQDSPVLPENQGGIPIHLHCTGCSENVPEPDVFDITGYRAGENGQDEVSFICPLCGAVSTSRRLGRV